eukprot:gnl/TRDRNA2_/TRDRNA2_174553_c2_seq19.p1 gnl/TRDRNA2_/TRDRNA2_174553_c2~~gnl/TRDRNA2_/TRDRNA2_174553_c2_seq19.p1  ORF type:complete len:147 (-),score=17.33 gnl/TRDRNA2_/TRDRNA2_174553_c2_seq19:115-489(-)
MEFIDSTEELRWEDILTDTQEQVVSIARALITNPEVLCIQKPAQFFDEHHSQNIMHILKEFCKNKGIEKDPATWQSRRPRTCIFTSAKLMEAKHCDQIFWVSKQGGVVRKEESSLVSEFQQSYF